MLLQLLQRSSKSAIGVAAATDVYGVKHELSVLNSANDVRKIFQELKVLFVIWRNHELLYDQRIRSNLLKKSDHVKD